MRNNLSKQEVSALNFKHVKSVDKFYRMFIGVGSQLVEAKNDCLTIEINVNDKWLAKKSLTATALHFLNDWKSFNKELQAFHYHRVYIYKSGILGFSLDPKTKGEEIQQKLKQFKSHKPRTLLYVFSNN